LEPAVEVGLPHSTTKSRLRHGHTVIHHESKKP
jgi:hypothetical protein